MTKPGPLLAADELLSHQIVDTFARVGQSDRSWTEKIWAMAAARDGSLSVAFGLGKYINRDVMDAFAGVSRGTEQWTVRASRRLSPHLERSEVGPVAYDADGDARVKGRFDVPDRCLAPAVLLNPASRLTTYIGVTGRA